MNITVSFQVDKLLINSSAATFALGHVLKHSRAGLKLDKFTYRAYPLKDLCVVDCLAEYLKRRSARVNSENKHLFITYGKPYKAASIATLRRWVMDLFSGSKISKQFTPHSCRSAATSKANRINVNLDEMLKQGCWKNIKTFKKIYDKDIMYFANDDVDFMRIAST